MDNRIRVLIASLVVIAFAGYAWGAPASSEGELQLLYPDNNVSSRPLVEFRVRTDSITGHAFIALGKELDNGLVVFYAIDGFYPNGNGKFSTIKTILGGPGHVTAKIRDMNDNYEFRVKITPAQERAVGFVLKSWNSKQYSLVTENCVSLMNDVANSIGLKTDNTLLETPKEAIEYLKTHNNPDSAILYAEHHAIEARDREEGISRDEYNRELSFYNYLRKLAAVRELKSAVMGAEAQAVLDSGPPTAPLRVQPAAQADPWIVGTQFWSPPIKYPGTKAAIRRTPKVVEPPVHVSKPD